MIEAYSSDITVEAEQAIPFNSVTIEKNNDVTQQGLATFLFKKKGLYELTFDASAAITGSSAGTVEFSLFKNGVLQQQAVTQTNSSSTTDIEAIGFTTYVQVDCDDSPCCNRTQTTIQIKNTGLSVLMSQAHITIKKQCCC